MARFIIRRLLVIGPMLLIVISLTWGLIRLAPGNFYSGEKKLPPAIEDAATWPIVPSSANDPPVDRPPPPACTVRVISICDGMVPVSADVFHATAEAASAQARAERAKAEAELDESLKSF